MIHYIKKVYLEGEEATEKHGQIIMIKVRRRKKKKKAKK